MKPIIYCPEALGVRETDQAYARIAKRAIDHEEYDVREWRYRKGEQDDTMYARGLAAIWQEPASIIIVEHDMAPTPEMIDSLAACPHAACVQAYWISPTETGRFVPIQNVGVKHPVYGQMIHREDRMFPTYADWAGPGLAKLSYSLRELWYTLPITVWGDVERSLNTLVKVAGERWHVHLPVCEHLHGFHRRAAVARG